MTIDTTYALEGSIKEHADKTRIRLWICDGSRIVEAFSRTFTSSSFKSLVLALVAVREFLPREFDRDAQIQRQVYSPIEQIWRDRLRLGCPYY